MWMSGKTKTKMKEIYSNNHRSAGRHADDSVSPGNRTVSAGEIGLRRQRAAAGVGITPPRRKPGLPKKSGQTAQRPVTSQRKSSGSGHSYRLRIALLLITLALTGTLLLGIGWAYRSFTGSDMFGLQQVLVKGAAQVSEDEVVSAMRQKVGAQSLWRIDLSALRQELLRSPRIRDAQVKRILPDKLEVTLFEREPFAPALLQDGSVIWVDRDGTIISGQAGRQTGNIPPIISGLHEGKNSEAAEIRKEQLQVYQQMLGDFDKEEPRLSERIDEINLADTQDVRLRLQEKKISVVLGPENFRTRLLTALKVLDAVERKDLSTLSLLNARDAERILNGEQVTYLRAMPEQRMAIGFAVK